MTFWETAYKHGWATIDQLRQAVAYSLISADQYKQITGENYAEADT